MTVVLTCLVQFKYFISVSSFQVHSLYLILPSCIYTLKGLPKPIQGGIGVGLDSCVIPTRHPGFYLVQTTDLYPPVILSEYSKFCHVLALTDFI